jgi:tRNA-2-methylthio-N6-dimethylallyladenosine synthase
MKVKMVGYYHIWWAGCQMNKADSQQLASELERIGYRYTPQAEAADVIVLNTCVVRQSAEDRALARLSSLKPLKTRRPDLVLGLMGCLVGQTRTERSERQDFSPLRAAYPFVDVFLRPSETKPLIDLLRQREAVGRQPSASTPVAVSSFVPIIYGCNHACTFCVIPSRRGREHSRPVAEVVAEVRNLVERGAREITLLGQIVDRYGHDLPNQPDPSGLSPSELALNGAKGRSLADLLRLIHDIDGLHRIRFLTSHPNYLTDRLLDAVAELPKVCEHIEVPVQAGDDEVLRRMKRGYAVTEYRHLIDRIRAKLPDASIATDVIVGFPGESAAQFEASYNLLRELQFDVVHVACYSPRPGTVAAKTMVDDVPQAEKERRRRAIEELQGEIAGRINARLLGQTVEVLVEENHRGKWKGRTRTNKLVFFSGDRDWRGKLAPVRITWAGPWSMQGEVIC